MIKEKQLNRWFWKWHILAGLFTLPVLFLLAVTGIVYLFKQDVNEQIYQEALYVTPNATSDAIQTDNKRATFSAQLAAVHDFTDTPVMQVFVFDDPHRATAFRLAEKGHAQNRVYVNPYTAEVTGQVDQKNTLMYSIRKLHGELLLGTAGTLFVELVASWCVVLILTGLYIWWPAKSFSGAGFFTIRFNKGKRTLWRDTHAVFGFWLSLFMLLILAGGMPWTNLFGSQLKWVQDKTGTGYPSTWHRAVGLESTADNKGTGSTEGQAMNLDQMVNIARQRGLSGQLSIKLPTRDTDVFTVANRAFWLRDQQVLHFDQYSGALLKQHTWSDVGILMEMRQVAMRLHQGEYGLANWIAVLVVSLLFAVAIGAGLTSYWHRKPEGEWGLPKVPGQLRVGKGLLCIVLVLAILFPMFGLSLMVLILFDQINQWRKRKAGTAQEPEERFAMEQE